MFKRLCVATLLSACPLLAHADGVTAYDDYAAHLRAAQEVTPLTSSEFGDQVSLYNGSTEFNVVDIDIPGNSKLPVQLRRRFEVSDRRGLQGHLHGFGEWDMDVPYLEGVFSPFGWMNYTDANGPQYTRCSNNQAGPYTGQDQRTYADGPVYGSPDEIWDGYQLHMPGGGYQDLLVNSQSPALPGVTDGNTYPWITKDYTQFTCLPKTQNDPGEGFIAVSPDGTKTYFDYVAVKPYSGVLVGTEYYPANPLGNDNGNPTSAPLYAEREKVFILASKVIDRFGNWVAYQYAPDANTRDTDLVQITSSDGRTITPTYTNGAITSVTSNVGQWTYGYVSTPTSAHYDGGISLNTVTRPDKSQWTYVATGLLFSTKPSRDDYVPPPGQCQLDPEPSSGTYSYTVTAPFGATATYDIEVERHLRSGIPKSCLDNNVFHLYPQIFDFVDNYTLLSKQVTGPGLTPQTWSYSYLEAAGENYFDATVPGPIDETNQDYVPQGTCPNNTPTLVGCAVSKKVVVTSPTEITQYTFGVYYAHNEGRLLGTEVDGLDGTVLRTTTNTFVDDNNLPTAFPNYAGTNIAANWKNPMTAWIRPEVQTTIVQDGVTFTHQTNAWDVFARPISVTRSSTLGYSKTEDTAYADNLNIWVISQLASVQDDASKQFITQNDYDPILATLSDTKSFGAIQKSYTYNTTGAITDGTLNSVADGLGNTTTLSNWVRGVPELVTHADNTTEQAAVNDSGWITSYIDENGYTTGYSYDAMGRVNQVTYPVSDSVNWLPTKSNFVQVNSAEFGLPAGHWRDVVNTGASTKTVYYDALLRPVLQSVQDTNNAATIHYTEQNFDAANRALFTSYPSATASAYNDLTQGTHATFDGLGRPLASAQDSELTNSSNNPIQLLTSYAYLPGFLTQVTNPRGFTTTTAYQVFDTPDTSHPTVIASPANLTTTIARDIYGKPLTLTRNGMWANAPISESRSYSYDANQRLCMRVEPETGTTLINYDAANNVVWTEPGSLQTGCITGSAPADAITRTYTKLNRPWTVKVPGSTTVTYGYYPDGALKTLSNGTNSWAYTYNKRRMPVTETLSIDGRKEAITHAYTQIGHESTLTYPSGLVLNHGTNALGQPTQESTYATGVSYFPNGGMSGFTYGNGIVHTLTQNARQLPLRSLDQLPGGAAAILDDTYTYDKNGNVTGIADGTNGNPNGRTMAYDGLDRLTGTSAPGQPWISASTSYDGLDNIRNNTLGTRSYGYIYDSTWRLSTLNDANNGHATVMTLGYDANGNVASKGNGYDSYTFDLANRMQSVNGKESYQYDGYGRRVKVTTLGGVNAGKIDYPIYDMTGRLLTEDDQRTNTTTDYINLNGSLVAKRTTPIGGTNWTKTYEHTDALRSPTYETDVTGTLTRTERYTPYGEPSTGNYVQGPGFTGHVTDAATGLTYAQQRYYDPVLARFLSVDPVNTKDNGASFNRFAYANDNPFKFTDPDGRSGLIAAAANGFVDGELEAYKQLKKATPGKYSVFKSILPIMAETYKGFAVGYMSSKIPGVALAKLGIENNVAKTAMSLVSAYGSAGAAEVGMQVLKGQPVDLHQANAAGLANAASQIVGSIVGPFARGATTTVLEGSEGLPVTSWRGNTFMIGASAPTIISRPVEQEAVQGLVGNSAVGVYQERPGK